VGASVACGCSVGVAEGVKDAVVVCAEWGSCPVTSIAVSSGSVAEWAISELSGAKKCIGNQLGSAAANVTTVDPDEVDVDVDDEVEILAAAEEAAIVE
jgi:hypothetical protein